MLQWSCTIGSTITNLPIFRFIFVENNYDYNFLYFREYKSEYKNKYRPFSQYEYVGDGKFFNTSKSPPSEVSILSTYRNQIMARTEEYTNSSQTEGFDNNPRIKGYLNCPRPRALIIILGLGDILSVRRPRCLSFHIPLIRELFLFELVDRKK